MAILTYEDFTPGRRFPLGPVEVSAADIIGFAREFDPQPMHVDEEAGRASILGGLAASGWHTSALLMRMMIESYVGHSTSQGSPGIDLMDWKTPVLADDRLSGHTLVLEARPMRSRPGLGIVRLRHELENQRGETVLLCEHAFILRMAPATEDAR